MSRRLAMAQKQAGCGFLKNKRVAIPLLLLAMSSVLSGSDPRVGPYLDLRTEDSTGDFGITASQESRSDLLCIPHFAFDEPVSHFEITDAAGDIFITARCGDGFAITGILPQYYGCSAIMRTVENNTVTGEDTGVGDTASFSADAGLPGSNLCTCEPGPGFESYGEACEGEYAATAVSLDGKTAAIHYEFEWTPKHAKGFFGCS